MITQLDPSAESFLFDLARTTSRLNQAQKEITSGKRVSTVSDAPDEISALLQARATLDTTSQIHLDLSRVKSEVDSAESAIASAVALLGRARVSGLQGATGTATAANRQSIADDLGNILEQLVAGTRTNVEGRFVFSGDADQTPPYTIDINQTTPVSAYLGSAATRSVLHPSGAVFAVARTAQQIFDSPVASESVFGSITALRAALLTNDRPAIDTALQNVTSAAEYLNGQHAFYGRAQTNVSAAIDFAFKAEARLKTQISAIEDADIATAALTLSETRFQRDAALSARARAPRTSLFDFLG
jgi:flagellar hook-associated protein 3 FlgL